MIKISADEGVATYYTSPYPDWDGDEMMILRGEGIREHLDEQLILEGLSASAEDKSIQLHTAFKELLIANGITILEEVIPDLDTPVDSMTVN